MKKEGINFSNIFSPNFMIRYGPGHMRNLSNEDINLNYANLFNTNKTSVIEDGISAVLGFDYKINEKLKNGDVIDITTASDQFNFEALNKTINKYFLCYSKD